VIYLW